MAGPDLVEPGDDVQWGFEPDRLRLWRDRRRLGLPPNRLGNDDRP